MEDVTTIFPEVLTELRGKKTKKEAADGIGISRVALGYYESGERKPDIEVLSRIAKYYHVSTDYLLGLTKVKNPDIETRAIAEKTGLSQAAIDTIRKHKEENPNFIGALNFLIEDLDFMVALSSLDEYRYIYMSERLSALAYKEASSEEEESGSIAYLQAADSRIASEYFIAKSFQNVTQSWTEKKMKEIDLLEPEDMRNQIADYTKENFGLG